MRSAIAVASALFIGLTASPRAPAQTLTTLYSFMGPADGSDPQGVTIHDGTLYGATFTGGSGGLGTVFAFDLRSGREKTLYSFQGGTDGAEPLTGVVYHAGKVYGTTSQAGQMGTGTVFAIDVATGQQTTLYSFGGPLDAEPNALTLAHDTLFGTTGQNGQNGYGIAFAIDLTTGKENTLHAFKSLRKGRTPDSRVLAADGVLFGTTLAGGKKSCGQAGCGTLYRLDTETRLFDVLLAFSSPVGVGPSGALALHNGVIYGATRAGGANSDGAVFGYSIGSGTTSSYAVGGSPDFGVVYDMGSLYGSHDIQNSKPGSLFSVNLATGAVSDVYTFTGGADGRWPGPLISQDGLLYGVTSAGGATNAGTLFSFSPSN
jgi:uncharacterized repeat protein (TIGR03803 family)